MILGCPKCRTRFRIDDAKLRSKSVKVRCSRCAHVFHVEPGAGEPEGTPARWTEPNDTSTRRVDAATLIALALESAPSPEAESGDESEDAEGPSSNPTQELPLSSDEQALLHESALRDDADLLLSASPSAPEAPPDLDELRGALDASGEDVFDELDRVFSGPEAPSPRGADDPPEPSASDELFDLPSSPPVPHALRDASVDLPLAAPPTSTFLDAGDFHPSTDLELAEALESDFFGAGSLPVPDAASSAPPAGPRPREEEEPEDLLDDGGFTPSGAPGGVPLGRLALVRPGTDDDELTRVAEASAYPLPPPPSLAPPARRGASRWPTWLGLVVGLAVSATFIPGWAPAPLDRIAPAIAEWVHPAARLRLPDALTEVRTEGAVAFPYQVGDRTVLVVRGEAVNTGEDPLRDVQATVLMLDGDRETLRASAPLGAVPDPAGLARRVLEGLAPPRPVGEAAVLEPGERAPFLVVFPEVDGEARRQRFRVEMSF